MKMFAETIKEINNRLDVPQPARSRVLLEIAADLEGMYDHYRKQGLSSQDARRRAIDHCDLSDDTLQELIHIHTSVWRRFMDRFSDQAQTRWERALLVVLLVCVAAAAGPLIVSVGVFKVAHPLVWLALGVTAAAVVFSGSKFYLAFIKQDHDARRLRAGLSALLVAAGADLLIGVYGNWMGLFRATRRAAGDLDRFWFFAVEWLLEGSSLLVVSFTAATLTALLWYVLANKVARVEQAEAAALIADNK